MNDSEIWVINSEFVVFVFLLGNKIYLASNVESQNFLCKMDLSGQVVQTSHFALEPTVGYF